MYPSHALPIRRTTTIIGLFLALAWTSPAFTAPDKRADTEALTHSLVGLNNAYQKAAPSAKSQALQKLIDATVERQAQLAELIKTDPGAVLRTAIPARIRNQMPAEVQAFIEQRLELEGELEVMYEDNKDGSHRLLHTLRADGERVSLHFKSPPPSLLSGTMAQVNGVLLGDAMAVESGEEDILTLACCTDPGASATASTMPALPYTLGEQRTLVMLVNFQDQTNEKPWTTSAYADLVFGTASDFFLEASYGQTWLSGIVVGWYTVPLDSTACDYRQLGSHANQAAIAEGIDLSFFDRFIYAFPHNPNCTWSGMGQVGGKPTSSWSNGRDDLYVIGHELGHNLGLNHSNNLECGAVALGDNCYVGRYGDVLDIMGGGISGHYNAFQKDRLGWLGHGVSPPLTTVETDGSYALDAYAPDGTGQKALKILKSVDPGTGEKTWYYLEYRRAVGFDAFLADYGDNVVNGVSVHIGAETIGTVQLLDMAPDNNWGEADWEAPALVAGESFSDPDAGVSIATAWTDNNSALVDVSIGPLPCIQADPSLTASPSVSDWVEPGTAVTYTVTLTSNDNAACSAADFDLSASAPGGWLAAFNASSLTLQPGASDNTIRLEVTSADSADGFYDLSLTAVNRDAPSYRSTATVTYVAEPVSVNQSPVALDDVATTDQGAAVDIAVLSNDSDPDGDILSVVSISAATSGVVSVNADNSLSYTPSIGFSGSDSFAYTISDGAEGSASANVQVTVNAVVNLAPVSVDDNAVTQENTSVSVDVLGNDFDPEGEALTVTSVSGAANGTVSIEANGKLGYLPNRRFKGEDSFTYSVTDGTLTSTARVTVQVQKKTGGNGGGSGGGKGGGKPKP